MRTAETAFRNTSGSTTADPTFRYTPPSSSPRTQRAQQPEIAMRRLADRRAVGRRMRVRRIRPDGHVHRHRDALPVGLEQQARRGVLRRGNQFQTAPQRLAHPQLFAGSPP